MGPALRPNASISAVLVWLGLSACTTDLKAPADARIACTPQGHDCPTGWTCNANLSLCVPSQGQDQQPPALEGSAVIAPPVTRAGVTLSVSFSVTEALALDPVVRVGDHTLEVDETGTSREALAYTYSMRATGLEPEGTPVPVTVDLLDRGGNLAAGLAAGNALFDFTPPSLVAQPAVTPAVARAGILATVALTFDEPLAADPSVTMTPSSGGGARRWTKRSQVPAGTYSFGYQPTGSESAGRYQVSVTATDSAGNVATALGAGALTLDFAPPAVDQVVVRPVGPVAAGRTVTVDVTASEPLAGGATLTAVSGGTTLTFQAAAPTGNLVTFSHVVSAGEDGTYRFHLSGLADAVGNVAAAADLDTLVVDTTAPLMTAVVADRPRYSTHAGFDHVTVAITIAETLPEPGGLAVLVAGNPAACTPAAGGYSCGYDVTGAEVEGPALVTATATDEAGNVGFASTAVVLDFTPPALIASAAAPHLAKLGDDLVYTITPSEPLSGPPTLATSGAGTLALAHVAGTTWAFHHGVTTADADGTYLVEVTLTDAVGNVSQPIASAAIGLDATAPTVTRVAPRASRLSAVPPHDQLIVDLDVAESLDGAGDDLEVTFEHATLSCTTYSAVSPSYSCTYVVTGTELEGVRPILVSSRDAAGNAGFASASVELDFTAPKLVDSATQVLLTPPPGCVLQTVDELGASAELRLLFATDEAVGADPVVGTSAPEALTLTKQSGATTAFIYSHTLAAGAHLQGAYDLEVKVADDLGNGATIPLSAAFVVDTLPPPSPDTLTSDLVVYRRVPWGSEATGAGKLFSVRGGAGALDADATRVFVYDSAAGTSSSIIGSASRRTDGGFDELALIGADRSQVWVAAVDAAGNRSPLARVDDVEWLASMAFKVPGRATENPSEYTINQSWVDALEQDTLSAVQYGSATTAALQRLDGSRVSVSLSHTWRELGTPGSPPPPRYHGQMAYDSARSRAVLYGGWLKTGGFDWNRVWEWDDASWTPLPTVTSPGERSGSAMAFDSVRGLVLLVGGYGGGTTYFNDVLSWDGTLWQSRGAAPWSARSMHSVAFDSARGRLVLFGGYNYHQGVIYPDTWEYDGSSWTLVASSGPAPRLAHRLAYDPTRGRVVLFGGCSDLGCATLLGDTWEWDGVQWTQKVVTPSPAALAYHGMEFSRRTGPAGQVVLFGGTRSGSPTNETWSWNGAAWTKLAPAASPPPLYLTALARANDQGDLVLAGGLVAGSYTDEVWLWDGTTWIDTRQIESPAKRAFHAMAYDTARHEAVVFGGLTDNGTTCDTGTEQVCSGTWLFNGRRWRRASPAATPSARWGSGLAFDDMRGLAILYGGSSALPDPAYSAYPAENADPKDGFAFRETWSWDGVTWAKLTGTDCTGSASCTVCGATTCPPAVEKPAMAWDAGRKVVVLFGGQVSWGTESRETWEWDGAAWARRMGPSCVGSPTCQVCSDTTCPSPRQAAAMTYDGARGVTVLFSGIPGPMMGDNPVQDTWEWDGSIWTKRGPAHPPGYPCGSSLAYDQVRGRSVLQGCFRNGAPYTFEWDGSDWTQLPLASNPYPAPPGHGLGMVYDPDTRTILTFGGYFPRGIAGTRGMQLDGTWVHDSGAAHRPVQLMSGRGLYDPTVPMSLESVRGAFWAGGTCGEGDGVSLSLWDEGAWTEVATNATPPAAASYPALELTVSDPAVLPRLLFGPDHGLGFAVSSLAPMGSGSAGVRVSVDYAEVSATYHLGNVYGWGFDTDGSREGWTTGAIGSAGAPSSGVWSFVLDQADPQLYSPVVALRAASYANLQVRARNGATGADAQLFWIRQDDGSWDAAKSTSLTVPSDGAWHSVRVPLSTVGSWTGTITQLRFDPPSAGGGPFAIDWIRLTD
jgi:hypothetical protein